MVGDAGILQGCAIDFHVTKPSFQDMEVSFFIFPGFQLLDLSGPLAAFELANFHLPSTYRLRVCSLDGGLVVSSSGLSVDSVPIESTRADTFFIVGGKEVGSFSCSDETLAVVKRAGGRARRIGSICTGAYLLAEAGLLDGRRATTHWRFADGLRARYPRVGVEEDRIFIEDRGVWTSAGITAGIDLALALIEDDLGSDVSKKVAQDLVVFHRRPGGQSQFSALQGSASRSDRISLVLNYARENLGKTLSLEELAERASLSPRQFARVFKAETGKTPAKFVETMRVEAARIRVEENVSESFEEIALATGFRELERMRRAFVRTLKVSPQELRRYAKSRQILD